MGFEPTVRCRTTDFESVTFDHSDTFPQIIFIIVIAVSVVKRKGKGKFAKKASRRQTTIGTLFLRQNHKFSLATFTISAKAAPSFTARSASILRFTSTPALVRPQTKRL